MPKHEDFVVRKHQLYLCAGKEVILEDEAERELDSEGKPSGRVLAWKVSYLKNVHGGEIARDGEPVIVKAGSIQWIGRAVPIREAA